MRTRARRIDLDVQLAIQAFAERYAPPAAPNAAEIHRLLLARFEKEPEKVPTERTVRRVLRELETNVDSAPWTLEAVPAEAIDASVVMPVLAPLIESWKGERRGVTVEEARWISTIRAAAPDIDPRLAFSLAREYLLADRVLVNVKRSDCDAFLSFAPWRSADAERKYAAAVEAGWIGLSLAWIRHKSERRQEWLEEMTKTQEVKRGKKRKR